MTVTTEVTVKRTVRGPSGGDWGIIGAAAFACAFNCVACARRREYICGALRRHYRAHPVAVALLAAGFCLHVAEKLGCVDPLRRIGLAAERSAEIARSWRRVSRRQR